MRTTHVPVTYYLLFGYREPWRKGSGQTSLRPRFQKHELTEGLGFRVSSVLVFENMNLPFVAPCFGSRALSPKSSTLRRPGVNSQTRSPSTPYIRQLQASVSFVLVSVSGSGNWVCAGQTQGYGFGSSGHEGFRKLRDYPNPGP